jgi:integrase
MNNPLPTIRHDPTPRDREAQRALLLRDATMQRDPAKDAALAEMVSRDRQSLENENTGTAYAGDIAAYRDWCLTVGVPAVPATPEQLGAYVKHLANSPLPDGSPRSPRSLARVIASIQSAHKLAGLNRVSTEYALAYLGGYQRLLSEQNHPVAQPRKAAAARADEVALMLATIDRTTLRGARDAAVILIGYCIAGRASEVASLDFHNVTEDRDGIYVNAYRRKVKKWTRTAIPRDPNPDVCPVRAYEQLRDRMAEHGLTTGPLFVAVDSQDRPTANMGRPRKDGTRRTDMRISTATVAGIVRRAAEAARLDGADKRWSGHSLRRGMATDLEAAGVSKDVVADIGGWARGSRALHGYNEVVVTMANSPVRITRTQDGPCKACGCTCKTGAETAT